MVVVGQPVTAPVMTATVTAVQPVQRKARDFLIFSVILMILCFLHGNIPNVLLTLPALICSLVVRILILACHDMAIIIYMRHIIMTINNYYLNMHAIVQL